MNAAERNKVLLAAGQAWRLASKYEIEFNTTTLVVAGPESSSKTSFIERYLGLAFSVVKPDTATKRPTELLVLPTDDGEEEQIEVTEEIDDNGGKSGVTKFETMDELADWLVAKNRTFSPRMLFVQIRRRDCPAPKRIIDLPGLRSVDDAASRGAKEVTLTTIRTMLQKPNTLILCLNEATQLVTNAPLVSMLVNTVPGIAGMTSRLLPVLTKSDIFFQQFQTRDAVVTHLLNWQRTFFDTAPLLCGYSIRPNVAPEIREVRQQEYETANARERTGTEQFISTVVQPRTEEEREYWNTCVGFDNVVEHVLDHTVRLDQGKIPEIMDKVKSRTRVLELEVRGLDDALRSLDLNTIRVSTEKLSLAVLTDMVRFSTQSSGQGNEVHTASDSALAAASKTLEDEEQEFQSTQGEFSLRAMQQSWRETKLETIDYTRANDYEDADFPTFYRNFVDAAELAKQGIPNEGEPLMAGPAMHRSIDLFECMSTAYMQPSPTDRSRILNVIAIDPDIPFYEHRLKRILRLAFIYAMKMRPLALYFVQKTCYLMSRCLKDAWDLNMKNAERREFVDQISGSMPDNVFEALRRGFVHVLLRHGMHAYVSAVSDHVQQMHHLGAFRSYSGFFNTPPADAAAAAKPPTKKTLLKDIVLNEVRTMQETLQRAIAVALTDEVEKEYPLVTRGVREAVQLVGHSANHARLPSLTCEFVRRMIDKKVITDQDKVDGKTASHVTISDVLHPMGPEHMGQLLGASAVVFAHMCPQFVNCVITRCVSGLLQSPGATTYNAEYFHAMRNEIYSSFANEEGVAVQKQALLVKRAALQEELSDFQRSLNTLRGLV